jgi:hypothetical protein
MLTDSCLHCHNCLAVTVSASWTTSPTTVLCFVTPITFISIITGDRKSLLQPEFLWKLWSTEFHKITSHTDIFSHNARKGKEMWFPITCIISNAGTVILGQKTIWKIGSCSSYKISCSQLTKTLNEHVCSISFNSIICIMNRLCFKR